MTDEDYMAKAFERAERAAELGEVPIGAVVVIDGKIVGYGENTREQAQDPLGHAEIAAIKMASRKLASWRLEKSTLYTTLEPCLMCAGAIFQARIPRLVFGAADPKGGVFGSLHDFADETRFNHTVEVEKGVLEQQCAQILVDFFSQLRKTAN